MSLIDLRYGSDTIPLDIPAGFDILEATYERPALADPEIGHILDSPIDSAPIDEVVRPGESVLLVVPDATRSAAAGQMANLLVRRLIAGGTLPGNIQAIFANGIHRKTTEDEKRSILTPFLFQRIKSVDHDARDLASLIDLGETSQGIRVELNKALTESDHVITIGGVGFHYFAGFGGGRKMILPGLGSTRTIAATHRLAFDCETKSRRDGVDTGLLAGNAVHEAFIECVEKAPPSFSINSIVNSRGEAVHVTCGNWKTSHEAACREFAAGHTVTINEKRPLVIASCGGAPHDVNMIQAHKTLDVAARACEDGGTIVFVAECGDGLGRKDFLDWFDAASSGDLADRICEKYQVNGQTAWSLLQKAERFNVKAVSSLPKEVLNKMRLDQIEPHEVQTLLTGNKGYVIPAGSKINIVT